MAQQYAEMDPDEIEQDAYEIDTASSSQTSTLTWINWYTSLTGHDYFCEAHEEFIEDDFNLTGLQSMVPFWREALDMVLDVEPEEDSSKIPDVSIVESSAELLYGLVHQRFILTKAGLSAMVEKYDLAHFGACPRVFCNATPVLPCGRSDMPGIDTVKLYCPNCGDMYTPPSSKYQNVDGAFFGTSFAPLFFQTYPELHSAPFVSPPPPPSSSSSSAPTPPTPHPHPQAHAHAHATPHPNANANPNPHGGQKPALGKVYTPKIYGFRVSEQARSGPRMGWLRERPANVDQLSQVDYRGRWKVGGGVAAGEGEGEKDGEEKDGGGGGGGGRGKKEKEKGRLFDEDEDEDDDEEEEEEEEDAGVGGKGGVGGKVVPESSVAGSGRW
ncbi:casein kinase II subunit beta [Cryptococcus wingfieldii CBS 7118]|uniref:Casein kinase II subunit beta n=1 Tax=Cryptococcus wingfieldii CBS 7118 TaxID=1295528 RepID=A0A1E3HNK8_9TREE|nr:casein kinase II subunit beta [Cryptococcus wingfieldii CBS 7118]ODN77296.1 casein kinase II subunit beta [Cryptococcus wingfieldii CBS 7118]